MLNINKSKILLSPVKSNCSTTRRKESSTYLLPTTIIDQFSRNKSSLDKSNMIMASPLAHRLSKSPSSSFKLITLLTTILIVVATIASAHNRNVNQQQQQQPQFNPNKLNNINQQNLLYRAKRQVTDAISLDDNAEATTASPTTTSTTTTTTTTTTKKPKTNMAVNYTLVDELFRVGYADEFVVAKWKNMSTDLQKGVSMALKSISPKMVSMSSRVTGNCAGGLLKWILNLKNLRTWAVQMLDAAGKPTAGLLEGSLTMFGNYRQCLSVRAPDDDEIELTDQYKEYFRGRYCILHLKPFLGKKPKFYGLNATYKPLLRQYKYYEKTIFDEFSELATAFNFINIRMDICVPSLCSRDDIQRVSDQISELVHMRAKVIRCDVEPLESEPSLLLDAHDFAWGGAMLLAVMAVAVSSLLSLLYSLSKKQKSKLRALLTSMSVGRSLDYYTSVDCDRLGQTKPLAAYGLRLIVVLWIFLVHASINLNFQFLREMMSLRRLIMEWPVQFLINSSLQFDTLIIITAFTIAYYNIDSNLKDLIKYTIDKYVRLVPSILFLVGLTILTPLFYQNHSPVWKDYVDVQSQVCKSTGLVDLTFLQNFLAYNHICLPHTWVLCVELQLLVLAIPLIAAINKSLDMKQANQSLFRGPAILLPILAALGWFVNFGSIYTNELPPAWFYSFPDKDDKALYFTRHLMKTWNHLSPFAIGLLMGFVCKRKATKIFNDDGQPERHSSSGLCEKFTSLISWMGALTIMGAIIFSTYNWSMGLLPPVLIGALYNASARLLWSLACAMILYNISVPNKHHQYSTLSNLLSSRIFVVLGRLSFLAYMIFPYVHTFVLAIQEQPIFSSLFMMFHSFMGNVIITFLLAFIISILIELPFRRLVKKCILGRRHCTQLNISPSLSDCDSPTLMKPQAPKLMSNMMSQATADITASSQISNNLGQAGASGKPFNNVTSADNYNQADHRRRSSAQSQLSATGSQLGHQQSRLGQSPLTFAQHHHHHHNNNNNHNHHAHHQNSASSANRRVDAHQMENRPRQNY